MFENITSANAAKLVDIDIVNTFGWDIKSKLLIIYFQQGSMGFF